jgi:hypothetical protein
MTHFVRRTGSTSPENALEGGRVIVASYASRRASLVYRAMISKRRDSRLDILADHAVVVIGMISSLIDQSVVRPDDVLAQLVTVYDEARGSDFATEAAIVVEAIRDFVVEKYGAGRARPS